MHPAFAQLGLPDDADERAIKRAYARLLKTVRPDEDPEGFQRLHAAYREALQACAWHEAAMQPEAQAAALPDAPADSPADTSDQAMRHRHVYRHVYRDADRRDADRIGAADSTEPADRDTRADGTERRSERRSHRGRSNRDTQGAADRHAGRGETDLEAGLEEAERQGANRAPHGASAASGPADGIAEDARSREYHARGHDAGVYDASADSRWPHTGHVYDGHIDDAHARGSTRPQLLSSPFASSAAASDPWAARALAEQVLSMAEASDPDALSSWLQAQPALWSLPDKAAIADAVVDALQFDRPPLGVAQFDTLAEFFGLFDFSAGHAPEILLAVRDRLALIQALEGGDVIGVAERLHPDGGSRAAQQREIRRLLQQLRRPWSWPQALAMTLVPGLPSRLRRFTQTLRGMGDGDLPASIDPRQGSFWEAAGDRERWSWPRAAVLALRLALYPLALPLLSWLLQPGTLAPEVATRRYLALFTALGLGWAWLRLSLGFAQWQAVEDTPDARWARRQRAAAIPLLLTLGLTLHFLPGTEPLSWLLVPMLLMGTVARVAGSSYSAEALVLVLRNGWVWVAVPLALALFGAFAGIGAVRGMVYVMLAVLGLSMWFGARSQR